MQLKQIEASKFFAADEASWFHGSVITDPLTNDVLVDTGPLPKGNYIISGILTSTVDMVYELQHRNSAGDGTLRFQRRRVKGAIGNDDFVLPVKLTLSTDNQRIRIACIAGITGEVQASLFVEPTL